MSSTKSAAPLHIELQPSRRLLLLLSCLYAGAVVSILLLSIPLPERLALVAVVLLSYPVSLNRIGWFDRFNKRYPTLFRPAVTALHWRDSGEWELHGGGVERRKRSAADSSFERQQSVSQQTIAAQLQPASTVHPFMTVLNFFCEISGIIELKQKSRTRGRRIAVVILPDSLDAEDFRRLRVHLLSRPLLQADSAAE